MGYSDETEIVLLPGLDGTGRLFGDFVSECPPGFVPRVVEYPRDRFLGYRDLLHLVEGQLPGQSEFIILGESFSGPLAVMLAARGPRRLKAVVLVATFVKRPRPLWTGLLPWRTLLRVEAPGVVLRWLVSGPGASRAMLRQIRETVRAVASDVLAARIREVLQVNVIDELRQITVPILYLQGTRDRLVPPPALRTIRRVKPEVVVARIAAPHMVLQTAARESWEHIVRVARGSV